MRVSETRAGTWLPAFPVPQDIRGRWARAVALPPRGPEAQVGVGLPSVQQCGLHFCSPASQTHPAPAPASPPQSQAEDSGTLHSSPCCHAPSLTGVLSRCLLECVSSEYLDHLTPCMARTHVIFCLCHLSAGELWPLGLAVFPTVPWPGLWLLLYLFQKPGPWACSSSRRLPRAQPSTAGSCLTGAALGYLSPAHLPCCPLYHTRRPRLLCCGLAPRW